MLESALIPQLMKIAAIVIQAAYDSYCLWTLSPRFIAWLRQLEEVLEVSLCNRYNVDSFLRLLTVIERTNFFAQPRHWTKRYQCTPEFFPGRVGDGVFHIIRSMESSSHL